MRRRVRISVVVVFSDSTNFIHVSQLNWPYEQYSSAKVEANWVMLVVVLDIAIWMHLFTLRHNTAKLLRWISGTENDSYTA